jgi:hypothetical protein
MRQLEQDFHELTGAINAIGALKEGLELRLEEARDDCVREALDNVITLVGTQGIEYQHRRSELHKELGFDSLNESGL